MSFNWLRPDWDAGLTIPMIPVNYFLNLGLKALVIDVDNTLVPRREILLSNSTRDWLLDAKNNLKLHLLSNNPSKKRISAVAEQIEIPYTYRAAKPRSGSLQRVLDQINIQPEKVGMIGDRLFTDIIVGNRLGLYTILVKPINEKKEGRESIYSIQNLERNLARVLLRGSE